MKKLISITLVITMLMSILLTPGVQASDLSSGRDTTALKTAVYGDFTIGGTEYYGGMEVIEDKSQLDYSLSIGHL